MSFESTAMDEAFVRAWNDLYHEDSDVLALYSVNVASQSPGYCSSTEGLPFPIA